MAPYEPYHPQNPPQRHHRGFGMPSSYSRSRRQMQCVNKECQYGFVPGSGEEPQAPEEAINFYDIEEEEDTAFPALPSQGSTAPIVHGPAQFWVARRGPNSVPPNKQTSSEEEEETSENGKFHEDYIYASPDHDCETATVFSSAEPTANLQFLRCRSQFIQLLFLQSVRWEKLVLFFHLTLVIPVAVICLEIQRSCGIILIWDCNIVIRAIGLPWCMCSQYCHRHLWKFIQHMLSQLLS
ncbi:putative bifunctional UDP-N-acetylglucosamine transferase and deubiquitinase ALG13 [Apus apus]|uniref:putative bifunctional UDP-N-acetylglucosamine transferase and deubiquitinase ALG13 n=1 Tax=Apus apus TaxID=8895 RepID=UPI0021F8C04C|nr:putative bifunctional UDP-N-acetylglucosamine transferase and deubiquitinase ALG13 [Apus apus]